MEYDLFISHKTDDDHLVTGLALGLEGAGIRCYVDHIEQDFNKWTDLVSTARNTSALLLLLTPNSADDMDDNLINEAMAAKSAGRPTILIRTPDVAFGEGRLGAQFMGYSWITWDPAHGTDGVVDSISRRLGRATATAAPQSAVSPQPAGSTVKPTQLPLLWYFDDDPQATQAFVDRHASRFHIRTFTDSVEIVSALHEARADATLRPEIVLVDLYCPVEGATAEDRSAAEHDRLEFLQAEEDLKGYVDAAWKPIGVDIVETVRDVYPPDRLPIVVHTQEGLFLLRDELIERLEDLGMQWLLKERFSPETDRMIIERIMMTSGHRLSSTKPRVLIIDDNPKYIESFITRQGSYYEIQAIASESEVLSTLRRSEAEGTFPDVFVVDMYYPRGTDDEAMQRIDFANQKLREFADKVKALRASTQKSHEPVGLQALRSVRKVFPASEVPAVVYAESAMLLLGDEHIQEIERLGGDWLLKGRYDARTEQTLIIGKMLDARPGQ